MNRLLKSVAILSALGATTAQAAEVRTAEQVMAHHNAALKAYNIEEFLSDYTEDSVAVTARGIFIGKAGIRKMVEGFGAFRGALSKMEVSPEYLGSGVVAAHFTINPGTPNAHSGVDVMIIRDGKILFQAPQPPPPPAPAAPTPSSGQ